MPKNCKTNSNLQKKETETIPKILNRSVYLALEVILFGNCFKSEWKNFVREIASSEKVNLCFSQKDHVQTQQQRLSNL